MNSFEKNYICENDKVVASAITFHLFLMNCKNCFVATSSSFFAINSILNIVCWTLIFSNYIRIAVFKRAFYRIHYNVIIILSFLFAFCFISQINNYDLLTSVEFPYNHVRKTFITFLSYCVPCFIACSVLQNPNSLLTSFYRYSWILFVVSIVSFFLYVNGHSSSFEYSMSYGNDLLFSVFVFLFLYYERKNICDLIKAIILTICVIICGSRGPLISISCLILLYVFFVMRGSFWVFFLRSFFVLLMIFFITMQRTIVYLVVDFLDGFGIQSRTLRMLSSGTIDYDSGRSDFFEKVINALNDSPVLGLGAFGGSVEVGLTHNLYLDILANFGYFAGSSLILFIFYSLFKILFTEKNYSLTVVFFSLIMFPRGFFGYDFWSSKELWILFGLIVSYYSKRFCQRD